MRPTSAVRRYLTEDTDALTAAKELGVDSVLEGSFQRADDRLRVSVNLLRCPDGASLWSDSFDLRMADTRGVFLEPNHPEWVERAKAEIERAQALDPQLAETHLARFQLLYSEFEGYQGDAAVREVRLANQLNPDVGHNELAYMYNHLGLEDLATRALARGWTSIRPARRSEIRSCSCIKCSPGTTTTRRIAA